MKEEEAPKRLKRNKGKHRRMSNKNALFKGQQVFSIKSKERNAKKKNKTKQPKENKEGLGPSEVALWATSLDP